MRPAAARVEGDALVAAQDRDGSIDGLRVVAVVGVVCGHWLTTAMVIGDYGVGVTSPLRHLPDLAPATWLLQMLAPFFCAAGFAASRTLADGRPQRAWLRSRLSALLAPVGMLIACWAVLLGALVLGGSTLIEVRSLGKLVISPLWFLVVLALLWAAWIPLDRLDRRLRDFAVVPPLLVVCASDLVRFGEFSIGTAGEVALGLCATVCAWAISFLFGIRLARTGGPGIAGGLTMALAGMVCMALLVIGAGYPAMAVGVTGAAESNLSPPSLFVVALGAVQLGGFVLVRHAVPRLTAPAGTVVARLNRLALPVFLWHQSALVLVLLCSAATVPLAGLIDSPTNYSWVLSRLAWFPLLTLLLWCLIRLVGPRSAARRVR